VFSGNNFGNWQWIKLIVDLFENAVHPPPVPLPTNIITPLLVAL
jgi:hypothetical protein